MIFSKKSFIISVFLSVLFLFFSSFKEDYFEISKQIEIFTTLYKQLNMNYVDQTNPAELMDKSIKSMLSELDPYTVFYNEQDVIKFKINNSGEYAGIGASIQRKEDKIILKEIFKDYAADKAGLKVGDEIIQIDDIKLSDYKEDTSQLLKGTKNKKVKLVFLRQNKKLETYLTIGDVAIKAVPFYSKLEDNVGYIVLSQFNQKTTIETKEAIEDLKKQGVNKLILDLRGNPGGLLHEAVGICNLFVPKGETIVTTKSKIDKHNQIYKTLKEPLDLEISLAIIVDEKSASASEIVAGALQDLDRAVVVGRKSFGKGLVQRPVELIYGTQLKVTISRYYTPSGRCIQELDYTNKDEQGKAKKTEDKNLKEFKTTKGRSVFDGGGVLPDILVENQASSSIIDALEKNDYIFNYAVKMYYQNPNQTNTIVSDQDFLNFENYLKQEKFSLNTQTEKLLKRTLESAKKEKLDDNIKTEYENLLNALKKSESAIIQKNKSVIKDLILNELLLMYHYKTGFYTYQTQNNLDVIKAKEILLNTNEYNKILKK
jgi:carboxyl-terminal processing protease